MIAITRVAEADLDELLPLMRGYCDFYDVYPRDDELLSVARALIADPEREGVQLLARQSGEAVGFATIYWSWATSIAARIGVMNDLFVTPAARGSGAAGLLIDRCVAACRERGAAKLTWQTAPDNERAQRLYDRIGAQRSQWVDYSVDV